MDKDAIILRLMNFIKFNENSIIEMGYGQVSVAELFNAMMLNRENIKQVSLVNLIAILREELRTITINGAKNGN